MSAIDSVDVKKLRDECKNFSLTLSSLLLALLLLLNLLG